MYNVKSGQPDNFDRDKTAEIPGVHANGLSARSREILVKNGSETDEVSQEVLFLPVEVFINYLLRR